MSNTEQNSKLHPTYVKAEQAGLTIAEYNALKEKAYGG